MSRSRATNALDGNAPKGSSRILGPRSDGPPSIISQGQPAGGEGVSCDWKIDSAKARPAKFWSEYEDRVLKQMISAGASASAVAAKLGKTRNAAIGRANRLGIKFKGGNASPSVSLKESRKQGGIVGGKPSRAMRAARRQAKIPGANPVFVEPAVAAAPFKPRLVALLDLASRDCRFIVEGRGEHARFCAHESRSGSRYCSHHHGIVWQGIPDRRVA